MIAGLAGDPDATRTVYGVVIGLAVIGLLLLFVAIWLFRQTKVDPELLAPLERMDERTWGSRDPATQRRMLDEVRPAGAEPLHRERAVPAVDEEFEREPAPVTGFDDLKNTELATLFAATSAETATEPESTGDESLERPDLAPDEVADDAGDAEGVEGADGLDGVEVTDVEVTAAGAPTDAADDGVDATDDGGEALADAVDDDGGDGDDPADAEDDDGGEALADAPDDHGGDSDDPGGAVDDDGGDGGVPADTATDDADAADDDSEAAAEKAATDAS